MTEDRTLELSVSELRRLIEAATERILAYIESLPRQPSGDSAGAADLARSLREPLPETGRAAGELLDLLFEKVIPKGFNTAGPGYLAYIPGGGVPHAAVADLIAGATNRYVGVFAAAPGLAQIETNVVSWFCRIAGYPETARGILTTGGSLANFSAVVTARRERLPENFLSGTIYASDQVHHSIQKAAMLAGFPEGNVREIPSDELFRIRLEELARAIAADRLAGFQPFLVVGNAGSVNTGSVDDLVALADIAAREKLWFHVDGAYGGFFLLTERGRARMAGAERSDSITLDPHKSLFLPYGVGSLLVRDGDALKRAHALSAAYLPSMRRTPTSWISTRSRRSSRGAGGACASGSRSRCTASDPSAPTSTRSSIWPRGPRISSEYPGRRDPGRAPALDRGLPLERRGPRRGSPEPDQPGSPGAHQREEAGHPDGDDAGRPLCHPDLRSLLPHPRRADARRDGRHPVGRRGNPGSAVSRRGSTRGYIVRGWWMAFVTSLPI